MVKQGIDIKLLTSILEDFRLNDAQSEELQKVIYAISDGRLVAVPENKSEKVKKNICPQCEHFGLDWLGLSVRAYNTLTRHLSRVLDKRMSDVTIGDLTTLTLTELCRIRGMGRKGAEDVVLKLQEIGLSLSAE